MTSDEEEVAMRRFRADTEPAEIEALEPGNGVFGTFAVKSGNAGLPRRVEIRSVGASENTCDCVDFRTNGLGTCKHIESVLRRLRKRYGQAFRLALSNGNPRVEIYLDRRGQPRVRVAWPRETPAVVRRTLDPFFGSDGNLLGDATDAMPAVRRALAAVPTRWRGLVRISQDVADWEAELTRRSQREAAREAFEKDVRQGKRSDNPVKIPLFPYQREGMLHLAFTERALLADEMGLGKTAQAIAACALLKDLRGIQKVVVVSPASLKAEWEEQIAKFTALPAKIVFGSRPVRLKQYREPSFFYLCNYEQARSDFDEINRIVAPDVVILDEAQRIKNWQTKTARSIKRLASPFAFVLTGTPLENRIDEVYSLVEFVDPAIFGPLFRFNREFYELDERGRPVGLKNLDELHRRLRPVMLRRRKADVEEQIPRRTVNNYFVPMTKEQHARYGVYESRVMRLVAIARRRPLTKEEFDKLQKWLACMRMICDTPHILDPDCRDCPKLDELQDVLDDVFSSRDTKVIVFSEWERMLELVRERVEESKIGYAWHTGSVPQIKRRADIHRFKQDPGCLVFLSTDSGATGLNLQAANVVVNLDLPWNPAKLEQRIARAWRKHQTRAVNVINLVCENSIEHRMLGMLAQKQQLADGVLDGIGDFQAIKLPSGRAAFMERMEALMGVPVPTSAPGGSAAPARADAATADPVLAFKQDLSARLTNRLLRLESRQTSEGQVALLAVVDESASEIRPLAERLARERFAGAESLPRLEVLDRQTYETLQRLAEAGLIRLGAADSRVLHASEKLGSAPEPDREVRRREALKLFEPAKRRADMATVLVGNGFCQEAVPHLYEATTGILWSALRLSGEDPAIVGERDAVHAAELVIQAGLSLPAGTVGVLNRLGQLASNAAVADEAAVKAVHEGCRDLWDHVHRAITQIAWR